MRGTIGSNHGGAADRGQAFSRCRTCGRSGSGGKVDVEELYKTKCLVCHQDGNSQIMPNMSFADGVWKNGSSVKEVSNTIMNGVDRHRR